MLLDEYRWAQGRIKATREQAATIRGMLRKDNASFAREIDKLLQIDADLRRILTRVRIVQAREYPSSKGF